jgi:hypothetical protein
LKKESLARLSVAAVVAVGIALAARPRLSIHNHAVSSPLVDAANTLSTHLMEPLAQKDASIQAQKLIDRLEDRPGCEVYKQRLRDAGQGSPAAGTTQLSIIHAWQDAAAAGCEKPK